MKGITASEWQLKKLGFATLGGNLKNVEEATRRINRCNTVN
jgi:hypothetical protein